MFRLADFFAGAQTITHDDGPSVIPAFFNAVDAVSSDIAVTDTNVSAS